MGKASTSKKVARAASTGGGRTNRGTTPWGWWSAMALVVVLGVAGIVFSRNDAQDKLALRGGQEPRVGQHWHQALGFYLCDHFAPNVADNQKDPQGIHTHGDGVIHMHPFTRNASGENATFDIYLDTLGITLTEDKLQLPGDPTAYESGKTKCGDKTGVIRVFVNGEERTGDPRKLRFNDGDLIVVAFAPKDAEVPKDPPSKGELTQLSDVPGSPGATSSTVQAPTDGSTPPTTSAETGASTTVTSAPATTSSSTP
jgi:hypothetical protein